MDVMPNVHFDSNNKDQLRDFYNYLNQKVITVINNFDSSTLENNELPSRLSYVSSALIPDEAAENNHEHLVANMAGSIKSLL